MGILSETPNLFELSARPWLYELTQKYGREIKSLADVPASELDFLAKNGITDVYLLGVWSLGDYGLKHDRTDPGLLQAYSQILPGFTEEDIIGSPFAITRYSVNHEIGGKEGLLALKKALNERNIRLILDFVPNHTAIDSSFVHTNTKIYMHADPKDPNPSSDKYIPGLKIAYGRDLWGYVWTDTAQLNYWEPATWKARYRDLSIVASLADGVRCDMAMLALNRIHHDIWKDELAASGYTEAPMNGAEFWGWAIPKIKKIANKDFYFMAEMYWGTAHELLEQGFDYVYNKEGLYQALSPPMQGKAGSVRSWFEGIGNDIYHQSSFTSNHDEEPGAMHWGRYRSDYPAIAKGAVPITTFTIPGMKFHWMGEWFGFKNKLDVHLRRRAPEQEDVAIRTMYESLVGRVLKSSVLRKGEFQGLDYPPEGDNDKVLSWSYMYKNRCMTVAVNLSDHDRAGIPVVLHGAEKRAANEIIEYTELMTNHKFSVRAGDVQAEGNRFWVILSEWQGQVFEYDC